METPDLSLLTASINANGARVFRQRITKLDLTGDGILVYKNVKQPIPLPKLSVTGGPRLYRAQDDLTEPVSIADRILTVRQSKWDYDIDPEKFRNTYLAKYKEGDAQFADWINQAIAEQYLSKINSDTLYLGEFDAAGADTADLADGFGTIIADEIVAANITPIVTGALTNNNAVEKVDLVAEAAPNWMLKEGFRIYCSFASFFKYARNYRASFGFRFNADTTGRYKLDNVNAYLHPVSWMGSSQRLIASPDNNLAMGTDAETIQIAASVRRNIIESRPMFPVGLQIADLEALVVNDQA